MRSMLLLLSLSVFTSAFSQTKIGVINKQQLLDSLPSRKFLLEEMKQLNVNAEKERGEMDSVLVVLVEEYQKNAATWSDVLKQYQEARIAKMQERIKERERAIETEVKLIEAESIRKSELILKQAVTNVSTKLTLDVVIDSAETIYFKEKLDITSLVLIEMLKIDKASK